MNDRFYPITITKKNNFYTASIVELNISVKGENFTETLEVCREKMKKTIAELNEKKISLPEILSDQKFNIFSKKKLGIFIYKSVFGTLIFLFTVLLLIIMLTPFFKNYLNGPHAKEHFNKLSNKFGISVCTENKCDKPNE
tara:strand:+ start:73 stop:492 length:420 start_codon:yes stop_codon:yes gene_type:complete